MSLTLPLGIKWDPKPADIPEDFEKAHIIKDPLGLTAKLSGNPTPKTEIRETYELCIPQEFWFLFQRIIEKHISKDDLWLTRIARLTWISPGYLGLP